MSNRRRSRRHRLTSSPVDTAYMTGLTEGLLLNREGRAEPYLDGMLAIVSSPLGPVLRICVE